MLPPSASEAALEVVMKLLATAAALLAASLPLTPALAHCRTAHRHTVRHHAVRTACACRVSHRLAHAGWRRAAYREVVYREPYPRFYGPPVVRVAYARPLYAPYWRMRAWHHYRPRPVFYEARYFPHRHLYRGWFRRDRFAWR
jgi:hypothetical protein